MQLPPTKARLVVLVGALAAAGGLTVAAASASDGGSDTTTIQSASASSSSSDDRPGDVSGPCDEAEHANDPRCAGTSQPAPTTPRTPPTTTPGTPTTMGPAAPAPPSGGSARTLPTAGGTVHYRVDGATITLIAATPAPGWVIEVEQGSGREVELDFRSGTRRVQVNLELEDGEVRERVRLRNEATGTDIRLENGILVDDNSGPGSSGSSGSGHSGNSDNSGPGSDDSSGSD